MPKTLEHFLQGGDKKVLMEPEKTTVPEESSIDNKLIQPPFEKVQDPPAVLMMRRKAIRQFPNGQRVALYYIDKLKKFVSLPYTVNGYEDIQQASPVHEEDLKEEVITEATDKKKKPKKKAEPKPKNVFAHLQHIVKNQQADSVTFEDGKKHRVDTFTAGAILNVHGRLNIDNREKLKRMVHKNRSSFMTIANFAHGAHAK